MISKILLALLSIVAIAGMKINDKAHLYKEKTMEREFSKRITQIKSDCDTIVLKALSGKYKPKKVKNGKR